MDVKKPAEAGCNFGLSAVLDEQRVDGDGSKAKKSHVCHLGGNTSSTMGLTCSRPSFP